MLIAHSFSGHSCLVTGAASGIGRATAVMLAQLGANVAVTDLPANLAALDYLVAELTQLDVKAVAFPLDVTETRKIPSVFAHVAETFGKLDVLVNNAGATALKPAFDVDEMDFDRVMNVNLKGAFFCAQAAARVMQAGGRGSIVNVASQNGVVGNINRAPYCASKAGLINLTRALALEWAPLHIRVNSVSPTFVDNGHNTKLLQQDAIAEEVRLKIPLGRVASVGEVAAAICFLASPVSAMTTGHNFVLDGGWTAQ